MENQKKKSVSELREELTQDSSARELINGLFDQGTFAELGAYVKRKTTAADGSASASEFEGVITGYGAVNGRLTFAFVQDSARMKGAFGEAHARKICSLYDMAEKASAPVIGVFDSNGAKIEEGVAAIAAYSKVMKKAADASGYIPQIAVVNGVCAGSAAAFAAMFDFVVAKKDCAMYVTSPFLLGNKASGIAGAAKNGTVDILCEDAAEMAEKTKKLLSFLPQNAGEEAFDEEAGDDLNRLTPELAGILGEGCDMKAVIASVADNGELLEVCSDYAPEMICGFAYVGGFSCGVVANDPKIKSGAITPAAADKASGFVNLCGSYGIPVITLVDSVGIEGSIENEDASYASSLASLAYSYAQAPTPLITAIVGKAYGVAATIFGAKSIGADVVYATENASISAMAPEAAVQFLYADEIAKAEDAAKDRADRIEAYKENIASPIEAAKLGEVDDIVVNEELRQRICAAVEMMMAEG